MAASTLTAGGTKLGINSNVEPAKFRPVAWKSGITVPVRAKAGDTDVITGAARTTKSRSDVAVSDRTVSSIGPVAAPGGTVTSSTLPVAVSTDATVPSNDNTFSGTASLKPCP